jgi:hypothetical protein
MRLAVHVVRIWKSRGACKDLVGKPEEERELGRLRRAWKENTETDLHGIR